MRCCHREHRVGARARDAEEVVGMNCPQIVPAPYEDINPWSAKPKPFISQPCLPQEGHWGDMRMLPCPTAPLWPQPHRGLQSPSLLSSTSKLPWLFFDSLIMFCNADKCRMGTLKLPTLQQHAGVRVSPCVSLQLKITKFKKNGYWLCFPD